MELEKEIVVEKFDCLHEKTLVNIVFTYNWINSNLKKAFDPFNITVQQYNILRILRGQCKPATVNLLKDRMLDKMSDTSRIVDRLLQKELVERKTCPKDRRAVDISITQKGLDLLSEIEDSYEAKKVFRGSLLIEEMEKLNQFLDRLRG
jgi:DNA-binding MarR family transcriptional regulator